MDKSKLIDMNRRFDERLNELISLNAQFFTRTSYTEDTFMLVCKKGQT